MSSQLAQVLQIATQLALIASLLFGVISLRQASKQRADKGALDVLSVAVSQDHIRAAYMILDLPDAADPQLILGTPEIRSAANTIMSQYEYLGILVFQRIVPLDTLDCLVGGVVRAAWNRLRPYIERQREERNLPNIGEWFQWIAERLAQHGRPEKSLGTHIAFRNWKP